MMDSRRTKREELATLPRFVGGPPNAARTGEGGILGAFPPGRIWRAAKVPDEEPDKGETGGRGLIKCVVEVEGVWGSG